MSLSTSPGIPYSCIAVTNAEHTARAVARSTTVAYHAVPGMVIDPGDDLALPAISQEQAGRDVQLPQLHRRRALPPAVLIPVPAPRHGLEQLMTDQHPVGRGPGHTSGCPRLESSKTRRRGPHRRCAPRKSQITASTSALIRHGCDLGACDGSARASRPLSRYRTINRCTVWRVTPNRSATSVTGMPSRTCSTAWYLCSTTFNSRSIAGVSRIKWSHGVAYQAEPDTC